MATARDLDIGSDEYGNVKCSICSKKDKVRNANYYCYDCQKHLCTYCLATHNEFNENHNVVQGLGDDKDVITEKCGKHADELITLYCRQDDELLCRKCRLLEHRKCKEPQDIRESSAELNADPELQSVPAQLKTALNNINKTIEALDQHETSIQTIGNNFLKDLEDYAKKLLSRIVKLREKGKRDIKSKQEEILAVTKQHRQACALTKDEIKQCLDKITKPNERKTNMFVLKKKAQKIPQKVDALFSESKSLIENHQFHIKTDMKIFDSINSFNSLLENVIPNMQNVSLLSGVIGAEGRSVQATVGRPRDSRGKGLVERRSAQKIRKGVRMVNIKLPDDKKSCSISGCCHLVNGSLVIADKKNRRLKLVDPSSGMVTKYCYTDKAPLNVCCIGRQEVAVVFGSTQVHVYNAVSLTRTRTIELEHETTNIACHGSLLYCATGDSTVGWGYYTLYVHDVSDDRRSRRFRIQDYIWDKFVSSDILGIAVDGSGNQLYMTGSRIGLLCVNMDGQRIFHLSLKDLGLFDVQGVTTDPRGHVFVCESSNKVVKVTEANHMVAEILSRRDGIEHPLCLSYDVSRNQLCVGGRGDQILMVEVNIHFY